MSVTPLFYYRTERRRPARALCVQSLGVDEPMKPGWIRHGGRGGPFLFIHFQTPSVLRVGGEDVPAGGKTILWPAGARHHYGHPGRKWRHSWINVSGESVQEALSAERVPVGRPLELDGDLLFRKYLRALYDELHRHAQPDRVMLEGIVRLWMRDLGRAARAAGEARVLPTGIMESRRHMETHFASQLRLEDLAERAHLSVSQFCAVFKRHMGMPPLHYVQRLRMKRAEFLLEDANLAVYEVAARVGIEDAFYFSRLFRKHFGLSPREYRGRALAPALRPAAPTSSRARAPASRGRRGAASRSMPS